MPSRKNDIRISRKIPSLSTQSSNNQKIKSVRAVRKPKCTIFNDSVDPNALSLNSFKVKPIEVNMNQKSIEYQKDNQDSVSPDHKRRRSSAENYIKKRFLYDVVEPPKRTRQKKLVTMFENSSSTLLPASPRNLVKKHKSKYSTNHISNDNDLLVYLRSRRSRRLKPKMEYSPSYITNNGDELDLDDVNEVRVSEKTKVPYKANNKLKYSSNWSKNKIPKTHSGFAQVSGNKSLDEMINNDFNDVSYQSTYPDILLDDNPIALSENIHANHNHSLINSPKHKNNSIIRRCSPNRIHKEISDTYSHQPLFSSDGISSVDGSHPGDLLDFCHDSTSDHFDRMAANSSAAGIVEPDDDLESIGSHNLINNRQPLQQPSEELEEEDLIAPKLSILAASSTTAIDSDRVLVSTISEMGLGGGSRRKSPVRPMQVLRTKTAAAHQQPVVSSVACTNLQSSVLATAVDGSPYIFTSCAISNNRPISDAEYSYGDDDILSAVLTGTQHLSDSSSRQLLDDNVHQTQQPSSIVRLTNVGSNTEVTARSYHSNDYQSSPISTENTTIPNGGLLPSLLAQSLRPPVQQPALSRVFANNNTGVVRSPSVTHAKSVLRISHGMAHSMASNRRRPTILKRANGSNSLISSRQSVFDGNEHDPTGVSSSSPSSSSSSSSSAARMTTLSLLTSSNVHHHHHLSNVEDRNSDANIVPLSSANSVSTITNLSIDSIANAPTTTSGDVHHGRGVTNNPTGSSLINVPTKLLQLVTSPVSSPLAPLSNQTASDRLFGKRPTVYNKSSLLSSTTLSNNISPSASANGDLKVTSANNTISTSTPYRYAVVRGSADGKQYVLISNPRVSDSTTTQDAVSLNSVNYANIKILDSVVNTNETNSLSSSQIALNDNYSTNSNLFPSDPCLSNSFKIQINGAHLLGT